jgi:phage tail-like protein
LIGFQIDRHEGLPQKIDVTFEKKHVIVLTIGFARTADQERLHKRAFTLTRILKMATTADQIAASYPIPTYRFVVSLGSENVSFNSVSGLNITYDTIEYRDGVGNWFKMPGQSQATSITLRKGIFPGDSALYDWINSITLNKVEKKDITISLTDDAGTTLLITWNVSNAFPTSLTSPSLDATSNEAAVQELT